MLALEGHRILVDFLTKSVTPMPVNNFLLLKQLLLQEKTSEVHLHIPLPLGGNDAVTNRFLTLPTKSPLLNNSPCAATATWFAVKPEKR